MYRTLVFIPHQVAGLPILGFGWLLILLAIGWTARLVLAKRAGQSVAKTLASEGAMWGVVMLVVALVLPMVELRNVDGEPVGMAIRGYGVMLLAGVASAVGLAAYRAKRRGIDPEVIFAMAPWAFVGGIVGARLFYVIQYRDDFVGDSIAETLSNVMRFTEGGLVVYGSFIGGFIAVAVYVYRHRLSMLTFGDVIVPCLFLGVFFGRIGCLMNGCCYGGRCEDAWSALHFPQGSAVYSDQIGTGELLGLQIDTASRRIEQVRPGSLAERAGIQSGSRLDSIAPDYSTRKTAPRNLPIEDVATGVVATIDGRRYRWTPAELPSRALPVAPAQLISSLSSLILCLTLCAASLIFRREGVVMMLGFASYAVLRFVLELVRVDETGQFGTSLSIAQWVSFVVFLLSMLGLVWVYRQPPTPTLQQQRTADDVSA